MKFLVHNQPCYAYTGGMPWAAGKPALVFIHGAANDHSVWHLQTRYFAHHGWSALAIDLPGHGRSAGQARICISEYSHWLMAFLDNANIRSAVLVGHSMGSLIALDAALAAPDRVVQLVLMGASVPMPVGDSLLAAARNDPPVANAMITQWGHGPTARLGRSAVPGVSLTGANLRLLARAGSGSLHTDLSACAAYTVAPDRLAGLSTPTLILVGERDQLTPPRAGLALQQVLPDARAVVIPGAGHSVMYEAPNEALAEMTRFLDPGSRPART